MALNDPKPVDSKSKEEKIKARWDELQSVFSVDMPDIACTLCGREIYCGASKMCSLISCPKRLDK